MKTDAFKNGAEKSAVPSAFLVVSVWTIGENVSK